MEFVLRYEGGEREAIEAESMDQAIAEAHDSAKRGYDIEPDEDGRVKTVWVDTRVTPLVDGVEDDNESQLVTTAIDPKEPKCCGGKHDWQDPIAIVGGMRENPGVFAHGGGVRIKMVCMHCGCERVLDTWAQRSDTGEQGLDGVEYMPAKYEDAVRELRESAEA